MDGFAHDTNANAEGAQNAEGAVAFLGQLAALCATADAERCADDALLGAVVGWAANALAMAAHTAQSIADARTVATIGAMPPYGSDDDGGNGGYL